MTTPSETHRALATRQRSMMRNALEHDALIDGKAALSRPCDLDECLHGLWAATALAYDPQTRRYVAAYCAVNEAVLALAQYAVPYGRILEQERLDREEQQ